MKRLIVFLIIICSCFSVAIAGSGKDIVVEKIKVDGNCDMCKKRIEDAAYIKGVKLAEWDKDTHMLTITYRPSKTNVQAVAAHIAHAGHDTNVVKATEDEYKKLPDCCAYKTNVCNH